VDEVYFESQDALRQWLADRHDSATELWVGFHKKASGRATLTYAQARDEALCFGWIDGVRKTIDAERWTIRFTPRKRGSIWSQVNIKRVGELEQLGRMHAAGLAAFQARDPAKTNRYSFENRSRGLDALYEAQLRANPAAWAFFRDQPRSYRHPAAWWVMCAKQEATRQRRLATLIEESAGGRRIALLTPRSKRAQAGLTSS
jgi:uncharacterized protein YdeI (YjbR/CyaY-like superfamily)